jgi:hypothetical protein
MKQSTKTQSQPQTATPAITLADLTPEQLAELNKQLKAQRKANSSNRKGWNEIVDKMLHEKDGDEFKHTTADILAALMNAKLEPSSMDSEARANLLKKIQTRKQLLVAKLKAENKPIDVGYRASATGFSLTPDKVIAYLKSLDASQRKPILASIGVNL